MALRYSAHSLARPNQQNHWVALQILQTPLLSLGIAEGKERSEFAGALTVR